MQYIPYGRQTIDQDDIDSVVNVLKSEWLTQGPKIGQFEETVARYHNCKYAVAFCNGTAALHGAYYVSTKFPFGKHGKTLEDINTLLSFNKPTLNNFNKFSDLYWEFITTPITFAATANAGLYCGGAPKFVDVDLDTYCIDIEKIEDSITEDTRVIAPVSYAGYPADIKAIKNLPKVIDHNICVIHDACHALGARRDGRGIADDADMTILSFHPVKHITTGEGGMVLTNNKDYYQKLLLFRNHGITKDESLFTKDSDGDWYYEMQELGYNYRITDIQCALGISQMSKLDKFLFRRNYIAKTYEEELSTLGRIYLPPGFRKDWIDNDSSPRDISDLHAHHLFVISTNCSEDRLNLFNHMRSTGIGVQIHYIPINNQNYYLENGIRQECANANKLYNRMISLPIYYTLSDENIEKIILTIRNWERT